jgi:hypothetical protein
MGYLIPRLVISLSTKKKHNSHRFLAISQNIFIYKNRSLDIGLFSTGTLAFFFYRFVRVVRKNVLEYIIALVVVKNRVWLKTF